QRWSYNGFIQRRFWSSAASTGDALPASAPEVKVFRAGPQGEYERRKQLGELRTGDPFQDETVGTLQKLYDVLIGFGGHPEFQLQKRKRRPAFWSLFMRKPQSHPPMRGLYLWGGVGTGKTMMMDLFFHELPEWITKSRIHYHDFMLSVHSRLQKHKGTSDPLEVVATEITSETRVLCLDEFMVTDVADAMILNRLFKHLFDRGLVLVATSNRPPIRLYENGLQRDLFLPFIALLQSQCVVHEIQSMTDYRKLTAVEQGWYFTGPGAAALLAKKVELLVGGAELGPVDVEVLMGRKLRVQRAARGLAALHFFELCERCLSVLLSWPLSRLLPMCSTPPLILPSLLPFPPPLYIPTIRCNEQPRVWQQLNASNSVRGASWSRNVIYEHKTRLVCSAEGTPFELFERVVTIANAPRRTAARSARSEDADVAVDDELGFAKDRTVSRMMEMQSTEYEHDNAVAYKHMDGKISAHELATLLARLEKAATGSKHGLCGSGSLLGAGGDLIGFAEEVIREADVDGDGMIDFEEFLLSARAGPSLLGEYFVSVPPSDEEEESVSDGGSDSEKDDMEGDLFRAFEVFDRDSNGVITAEELQFVIGVLNGDNLTMEDCKRMIKRVDTNGDGCVDYSEFRTMMAGIFD
ncbi:unnamed protein product, partial [Closterium sp. NIES-53]